MPRFFNSSPPHERGSSLRALSPLPENAWPYHNTLSLLAHHCIVSKRLLFPYHSTHFLNTRQSPDDENYHSDKALVQLCSLCTIVIKRPSNFDQPRAGWLRFLRGIESLSSAYQKFILPESGNPSSS